MSSTNNLLKIVASSRFKLWDVKQFFSTSIESNYPVEELGKHIVHQTEKIQLSDYPDKEFTILGVSNKVGMFDNETVYGNKVKQKYHKVEKDWIAYNPYRINVGSIGIKTEELKGEYISPAYVVFSCKETLLPEFLWLMLKTEFFNKVIKDSTTGSVRQTLRFETLASIKAPIPSVEEQKAILKRFHDTINEAEKNRQEGDKFSEGLLLDIQSMVSNLTIEDVKKKESASIIQKIPFSSATRWEVDYILKEGILDKVHNSYKCDAKPISKLQTESLFGLSLKASVTQKKGMIPMLRMPNIVGGEIDCSDLKYLPKNSAITEKEPEKYLLKKGDFLINRTNSKELVGKSAIFNLDGEYTYASYLIRYRFDNSIVLPEYINILFMLPIVRLQIDTMSRQTAGQCNINSDEIGSIVLPIPSIQDQKKIIKKYNNTKCGATEFYNKSSELKKTAKLEFEKELFQAS